MRATRTLLVLLAVAVAGGCSHTTSPVSPDAARREIGTVQTSDSDSTTIEQRGVYTFGGGG